MDLDNVLSNVSNRDDFLKFISALVNDYDKNQTEWANKSIQEYFTGMASWVEDMHRLFSESKDEIDNSIDWNFIATILYTGSRYE